MQLANRELYSKKFQHSPYLFFVLLKGAGEAPRQLLTIKPLEINPSPRAAVDLFASNKNSGSHIDREIVNAIYESDS